MSTSGAATRGPDPAEVRRAVRAALDDGRRRTRALVDRLSHEDVHQQFHEFLSPVVWDVGHIGNFEELWLLRRVDDRPAHDPKLDQLYNAFENPRWSRGELPLLTADEAWPYLEQVRREALALLDRVDVDPDADPLLADGYVHRMIAQHESQHQETILQSLDLREAGTAWDLTPAPDGQAPSVDDTERITVEGGPFVLGTDRMRWTYDNERPAHTVEVATFTMDRFPVTNRRWAAFVEAGGYDAREHWSERGWQWRADFGAEAPQGWTRVDGDWRVRRFGRLVALDPAEPVQHVSFFEAEAFASWAGGRLPTELEWEKAASWDPATAAKRRYPWGDEPPTAERANVGLRHFGPLPVGSLPAGRSAYGFDQLAGDVYEWTTSPFEGWPGFTAFPYPEYSEVFFGGDYRVLRGSSWAIGAPMARATYRNWDHPYRQQLFAGLRLCWDGPAATAADGERR